VAARRLRAITASGEVGKLAQSVPDNGGVMFVPAFTGLGAPYWKPDARGTIVGLSRGSTMGHIARAALESIAFQSAALLEAMGKDAVAAGAGAGDRAAGRRRRLGQRPADAVPGRPARHSGAAAEGARDDGARRRLSRGLSCGVYAGTKELAAQWRIERTFHPTMSRQRAAELMQQWEHAVAQATH
jgi:glycerol kinase